MKVLHAFWRPEETDAFTQRGALVLWAETVVRRAPGRAGSIPRPPFAVVKAGWTDFLEELGLKPVGNGVGYPGVSCTVQLPAVDGIALPSPELTPYLPEPPDTREATLAPFRVDGRRLTEPLRQLQELHFLAGQHPDRVQPGEDFLFWYWFTRRLHGLLVRDRYLPGVVCRQTPSVPGQAEAATVELHGAWQWAPRWHEELIRLAAERMPPAAATGAECLLAAEPLLRQCSEVLLDDLVLRTPLPQSLTGKLEGTLLEACLSPRDHPRPWLPGGQPLERLAQLHAWRDRVARTEPGEGFTLGFRIVEPPEDNEQTWALQFVVVPVKDPSRRLLLADYWAAPTAERARLRLDLGKDFESRVLLDLGLAAGMFPDLWAALDTDKPQALPLDLDGAFAFLKEWAWVLEDAGFRVIVPAWWTPEGRKRMRIRVSSSAGTGSPADSGAGPGLLSLENLIRYRYQLAIGDQVISEAEWQHLLETKAPLVRFRGQWVELDRERMREMLAFWQKDAGEHPPMTVQELLRRTSEDADFQVDAGDALGEMLARLRDHERLRPVDQVPGLKAELRPYQRRGVAWLAFLEKLGLNGCLADDMGLGKTMQVIARLVQERGLASAPPPTLLVAPTSVIGNWQREVQRFAPQLPTMLHHGPVREQDAEAFRESVADRAMVITSYALLRRDQQLFSGLEWHRVVLDEAQNIKNPRAAQTRAAAKLRTARRLALTGTPVENRLTDLWSIFNFLNPGYLGTQARFRKRFELPVQRDNDPVRTAMLKRLVEPFILRRVKTDRRIIRDLPEKVEAIQYCHLSSEQAALYQTVVQEVEQQIDGTEGIERQGVMLATLTRLKQICNHPAQFLQDGSDFTTERSRKLQRLEGMLEEVMAEGDSVLIFSQFTELAAKLSERLRDGLHYPTYYLHGGVTAAKRQAMITEFQEARHGPAVFVLSLKAGGVGITLTRANHVFHFDRWWNPAVEDQASDRAFRIGQQKNVFVHKFVTLGTLEERINDMIESKKALAGAIVGDDESWLTRLDNERFRALIALNRDTAVA